MKRNGRLVKRIVTQESVNRYCEWLYGCEKSSGTIKQYKHRCTRGTNEIK